MRFITKQCQARKEEKDRPGWWLRCLLKPGHMGPHVDWKGGKWKNQDD